MIEACTPKSTVSKLNTGSATISYRRPVSVNRPRSRFAPSGPYSRMSGTVVVGGPSWAAAFTVVISPVMVCVMPGMSRSSGAMASVLTISVPRKVSAAAVESRVNPGCWNRSVSKIVWARGGNAVTNDQVSVPFACSTATTAPFTLCRSAVTAIPVNGPESPVPVMVTPSAVGVLAVTAVSTRRQAGKKPAKNALIPVSAVSGTSRRPAVTPAAVRSSSGVTG